MVNPETYLVVTIADYPGYTVKVAAISVAPGTAIKGSQHGLRPGCANVLQRNSSADGGYDLGDRYAVPHGSAEQDEIGPDDPGWPGA